MAHIYDSLAYDFDKKKFLNHPKIVEYLFNKPLKPIANLKDLSKIKFDPEMKPVRLEPNSMIQFDSRLFPMNVQLQTNLSKQQILIDNILCLNENKYQFTYISKWTFLQKGENNFIYQLPTVNYEQDFIYDFFGATSNHSRLILFAIVFEPDSSSNEFLKQFMLQQMNVNLLRLNPKSNFKKEIVAFIKIIKQSLNYVIVNPIKPNKKLLTSTHNKDLATFCLDYEYNHKISMMKPKNAFKYDSTDDAYFEHIAMFNTYNKRKMDEKIYVGDYVVAKILLDKQGLHAPKAETQKERTERLANDYIVELLK